MYIIEYQENVSDFLNKKIVESKTNKYWYINIHVRNYDIYNNENTYVHHTHKHTHTHTHTHTRARAHAHTHAHTHTHIYIFIYMNARTYFLYWWQSLLPLTQRHQHYLSARKIDACHKHPQSENWWLWNLAQYLPLMLTLTSHFRNEFRQIRIGLRQPS